MKKMVETKELQSSPPLESKYTIIDNISLSYNLVEYYLPILQQKEIKIVIRGLIMLKMQSLEPKKLPPLFIAKFSLTIFFKLSKWILKYKIIIQNPSAKPEKV